MNEMVKKYVRIVAMASVVIIFSMPLINSGVEEILGAISRRTMKKIISDVGLCNDIKSLRMYYDVWNDAKGSTHETSAIWHHTQLNFINFRLSKQFSAEEIKNIESVLPDLTEYIANHGITAYLVRFDTEEEAKQEALRHFDEVTASHSSP